MVCIKLGTRDDFKIGERSSCETLTVSTGNVAMVCYNETRKIICAI